MYTTGLTHLLASVPMRYVRLWLRTVTDLVVRKGVYIVSEWGQPLFNLTI